MPSVMFHLDEGEARKLIIANYRDQVFVLFMVEQVIKNRDVRLWKSIMGASSHPLKDLLPPLKNRALHRRSHPYQIPRVNTERFKKCFVDRCLFDSK